MKRTAFVMVLVLLATVAFASGVQEQEGTSRAGGPGATAFGPGRGPAAGGYRMDALTDAQETEVTGIYDEIDGFPVLRVDGKTYTVGVPGYRWLDVDLEPGDEVTVKGLRLEEVESIDGHIRVSSAVIDGTEYEIGPSRFGGRPGPSAGPGYGAYGGYGMHGRPGHRPFGHHPVPGYGPHAGSPRGGYPDYGTQGSPRQGYGPGGGGGRGGPRW